PYELVYGVRTFPKLENIVFPYDGNDDGILLIDTLFLVNDGLSLCPSKFQVYPIIHAFLVKFVELRGFLFEKQDRMFFRISCFFYFLKKYMWLPLCQLHDTFLRY